MTETHDERLMRRAIELAATVRSRTSPRPWVGAVVHPGGFEGATEGREGRHAEVVALEAAGASARGSTLYCTLEPCSHHGLTPPCAEAVIRAGVARVVVGVEDPDPKVGGSGIRMLREAGIEVDVGARSEEVEEQLGPYLTHRRTGRPYVVLKLAASLDGRTAAPDGSSRWITAEPAREDAHRLRAESDAILVGAGTVRVDDPALTVRLEGHPTDQQPLRVVLGRAPEGARVHPALEVEGELTEVLDLLGSKDVLQLLVEGGAAVATAFHRAGLVDHYVFYLAPALFGGDDARGVFSGDGAPSIDDVWRGEIVDVRRVGSDVRIDLRPSHEEVAG